MLDFFQILTVLYQILIAVNIIVGEVINLMQTYNVEKNCYWGNGTWRTRQRY
ncbi:hypothetical protein NUACC26_003950 [Scytonema sp. NUACC26]